MAPKWEMSPPGTQAPQRGMSEHPRALGTPVTEFTAFNLPKACLSARTVRPEFLDKGIAHLTLRQLSKVKVTHFFFIVKISKHIPMQRVQWASKYHHPTSTTLCPWRTSSLLPSPPLMLFVWSAIKPISGVMSFTSRFLSMHLKKET